jgi:transposase
MAKNLTLVPHLSVEELEKRYRQATDGVERTHLQIIWLLMQGKTTRQAAELTAYSIPWVREIIHRYNQFGPEGLGDTRHENPGAHYMLSAYEQALLLQALQQEPPDGGKWNSAKVQKWMEDVLDRKVHIQRGWEYLRRAEKTLRRPRPHHADGSWEEQETYKKTTSTSRTRSCKPS